MVLEEGVLEGGKCSSTFSSISAWGQFQFWQHVQRAGGQRLLPYPPMLPIQLLTNTCSMIFPKSPSRRQCQRQPHRQAAAVGYGDISRFICSLDRSVPSSITRRFCDVVSLQLLVRPARPVSHRLVRGIADDPDLISTSFARGRFRSFRRGPARL